MGNEFSLNNPNLRFLTIDKNNPSLIIEPCNPNVIKNLLYKHPYQKIISYLQDAVPCYKNGKEYDANPNEEHYDDDFIEWYLDILKNYKKYEFYFEEFNIFFGNKLYIRETNNQKNYIFETNLKKKNKVVIDISKPYHNKFYEINLYDYYTGENPFSEEEKEKIEIIKSQKNKKLQLAMLDPDIFDYKESINLAANNPKFQKILIERFNWRMTEMGQDDFFWPKLYD